MTNPLMPGEEHNQHAASFRLDLLQSGLMVSSGGDEISGYNSEFESVVEGLSAMVGRLFAEARPESLRFPPIISRKILDKSRYVEGFPQLAGMVHCFCGGADEHRRMMACIGEGEGWAEFREQTNVALTPASCYPTYPLIASRGPVGPEGLLIDVSSYCFRHEPSIDPIRLQMFRQREHVFVGTTEQVGNFLDSWLERSLAIFHALGLDATTDIAHDAFFGRFRQALLTAQKSQRLKTEILMPISNPTQVSACGSCNNHKTHFSVAFNIRLTDGEYAQTACAGFGLERLVLALLRRHGMSIAHWPDNVRSALGLTA